MSEDFCEYVCWEGAGWYASFPVCEDVNSTRIVGRDKDKMPSKSANSGIAVWYDEMPDNNANRIVQVWDEETHFWLEV